jgi:hypothetical protein
MSEEHLDFLSFSTRDGVGLGLGDRTGLVASGFVNGSRPNLLHPEEEISARRPIKRSFSTISVDSSRPMSADIVQKPALD